MLGFKYDWITDCDGRDKIEIKALNEGRSPLPPLPPLWLSEHTTFRLWLLNYHIFEKQKKNLFGAFQKF